MIQNSIAHTLRFKALVSAAVLVSTGVCSLSCSDDSDKEKIAAEKEASEKQAGSDIEFDGGDVPSAGGGPGGSPSPTDGGGGTPSGPYKLPEDFEKGLNGGWKVGEEITAGDNDLSQLLAKDDEMGCGSEIIGIVRDFRRGDQDGGHADFETFGGNGETGIVETRLGDDLKPILAAGDHDFTTTEEAFNQWYRTTDDINRAYLTSFSFEPNGDVLTFESREFFPVDDTGFGNQGQNHNFGFTTEIHTEFRYQGGESFSFLGDDDLWVFINGKLAIDLGGLHPEMGDSIDLDDAADDLGIIKGETYSLDLFHAERHSDHSNFRVDTNLTFTKCNIVVVDAPIVL